MFVFIAEMPTFMRCGKEIGPGLIRESKPSLAISIGIRVFTQPGPEADIGDAGRPQVHKLKVAVNKTAFAFSRLMKNLVQLRIWFFLQEKVLVFGIIFCHFGIRAGEFLDRVHRLP